MANRAMCVWQFLALDVPSHHLVLSRKGCVERLGKRNINVPLIAFSPKKICRFVFASCQMLAVGRKVC